MYAIRSYYVFVFGLSFIDLSAQNRLVSGNVADKETGLPLPMTNVFMKGTTIGTTSDDLGFFEFYVPKKCDTLYFSSIGYRMRCMTLSDVIKNVRIELEPDVISLAEVSVAPDDSWVRYFRITSYNVCYTKLLRVPAASASYRQPANPPRAASISCRQAAPVR